MNGLCHLPQGEDTRLSLSWVSAWAILCFLLNTAEPATKTLAPAATTLAVEDQHREVTSAIEAVSAACSAWREGPSPHSAEALAATLDALNTMLQPHLDAEEGQIVPLAAVTLTQQEWNAMGERARSSIPRAKMPVAFGMLLEPLDDDDRDYMKPHLPLPVRLLFPILIQRPWNAYANTLRNGT